MMKSNTPKKPKFHFPELVGAITGEGWTMEDFKQKARQKAISPSAKGWSLLMKPTVGMTEAYAIRAKNTLGELGFNGTVCEFEPCSITK